LGSSHLLVYLIAEGRLPWAVEALPAHAGQLVQPIHSIGPLAPPGGQLLLHQRPGTERPKPDRRQHPLVAGQSRS